MPERRLAAIVSADVVGFSRLMAQDEDATARGLAELRARATDLIPRHRGRLVDFTGDNFLVEFRSALESVEFALAIQGDVVRWHGHQPEERRFRLRVGVHLGDVRVDGERILGDGVNIAARLEALARPGTVCISTAILGLTENCIDCAIEDLGEVPVKNIPKPIRAHLLIPPRVLPDLPGCDDLTVSGFGGRPAIAVAPFESQGATETEPHFADGIAESLTARLSAYREFPVIAWGSTRSFTPRSTTAQELGRAMRVRYVVQGSVRREARRLRVRVELVDAVSGELLWCDSYVRELGDFFELQDEISSSIMAQLGSELRRIEFDRSAKLNGNAFEAWEISQRGWWLVWRQDRESLLEARTLLRAAVEQDAGLAIAYSGLAFAETFVLLLRYDPDVPASIGRAMAAAEAAVATDDRLPTAHAALALTTRLTGDLKRSQAAALRAIELDPSSYLAHAIYGTTLIQQGQPAEAIASLMKALRLSPDDPYVFNLLASLAMAHFAAGDLREAQAWAERSIERRRTNPVPHIVRVASLALMNHRDAMAGALQLVERSFPEPPPPLIAQVLLRSDAQKRLLDGLARAGWPGVGRAEEPG
jgi:adenylate cyclase